jgi:hypothetical protein
MVLSKRLGAENLLHLGYFAIPDAVPHKQSMALLRTTLTYYAECHSADIALKLGNDPSSW